MEIVKGSMNGMSLAARSVLRRCVLCGKTYARCQCVCKSCGAKKLTKFGEFWQHHVCGRRACSMSEIQAQIEVLLECDGLITRKLNTAMKSRRQDAIAKAAGLMEALNTIKFVLDEKKAALKSLEAQP